MVGKRVRFRTARIVSHLFFYDITDGVTRLTKRRVRNTYVKAAVVEAAYSDISRSDALHCAVYTSISMGAKVVEPWLTSPHESPSSGSSWHSNT